VDKMTSHLKNLSKTKREIEVDIDSNEVMKEFEKILGQYASNAKIPGFRPGKIPQALVKQRFYPEIKSSLIDSLVPGALSSELKAQKLSPVGIPVVSDIHFEEGQPLRFKAEFEVMPEFNLPEYKKIQVKKKTISVTDQEIDQALEELRQKSAEYIPVESRGVVDGDYVAAEVKGIDLKTKRMLPSEKGVILAGEAANEDILNKNLLGMKPGEVRNFTVDFDKNHKNKRLAGKKVEYSLKVISIKEKKLPKANNEFAKDLGDFKDLKDLKEKIKREIMASKEKEAKKDMAEEIIKKIAEKMNMDLPEILVEEEYRTVLQRLLSSQPQRDSKEGNLEHLKTEAKRIAEQNLKNHLILMKIAELEGLEVTDEQIQEKLREIAKRNNLPLAKVIENANREGKREELRKSLQLEKAVDFLVGQAIIEQ
jgi:trigger factor